MNIISIASESHADGEFIVVAFTDSLVQFLQIYEAETEYIAEAECTAFGTVTKVCASIHEIHSYTNREKDIPWGIEHLVFCRGLKVF